MIIDASIWASPWAFSLLPLLAAIGAWVWRKRHARHPALRFGAIAEAARVAPAWRARWKWIPVALQGLGIALAIAALARPQRADVKVKRNVEGIDIMLVLDVSDSMAIEDMTPNRMDACKEIIKRFIQGRASDRIGLVIFSGESYTRVPLTLDYKMLLQNLAEVKSSRNIKMGTAIGVGLANAVARLKDSTAKSRVIVFLTDGENNSGTIDPETALEIAKGYGLKIYSIGAGRDGDSQLPVEMEDAFGRKVKRYQPIHSTVNEELLGKMASDTGGKFYRAETTDALANVFKDIDRLEKTKIETNQFTRYAELYEPLLWAAIGCALASFAASQTLFRRSP